MPVTDPIADFLTRIRNANKASKKFVDMPSSNMKAGLAELMKKTNFIRDFNIIEDTKQNTLRVHLQYIGGTPSINGLKRISRPGLKSYVPNDKLPRVLNGLGVAIISTSKGLLTDKQARKEAVGGEVICHIW